MRNYRLLVGLAAVLAVLWIVGLAPASLVNAQEGGRPFLGVRVEDGADGARVLLVLPDSPADRAGLRVGDVIQAVDGAAVGRRQTLSTLLARYAPGDPVALTVLRRGETINLPVTLGEAPVEATPVAPMQVPATTTTDRGFLGVSVLTLTPEIADDLGLTVDEGALVREVYPGMSADRAGIVSGDVITAINGEPVDQERTLPERLYPYEVGDVVTITLLRGEEEIELQATLEARPSAPTPPAIVVEPAMPESGAAQAIPMLPAEPLPPQATLPAPGGSGGVTFNGPVYIFIVPGGMSMLPGQGGRSQGLETPFGLFGSPDFDWPRFLQEHPGFMEQFRQLFPDLDWQQWLDLLPNFPWLGQQDPFHQGVDPDAGETQGL